MKNSFYSAEELKELGLRKIGKDVKISRKASFYSAGEISMGDNVRIDDFCLLSEKIDLGSNIHISAGTYLFAGDAGIRILDFSTVSSRCGIYAISDDFSGNYMACSAIDEKYRNVTKKEVVIEKHGAVGTGTTILPGVKIGEGSAIGAMSLVNENTEGWAIYAGIPCRKIRDREKTILEIEKESLESC